MSSCILETLAVQVSDASAQHGYRFRLPEETGNKPPKVAGAAMQLCARWSEPSYQKSLIKMT